MEPNLWPAEPEGERTPEEISHDPTAVELMGARATAFLVLVELKAGLVASGCDRSGTPEAAAPDGSIVLADLDERATEAFLEVGAMLVELGMEPFFGATDYFGCDSPSPEYIVSAFGRYDHPDGRSSTRSDAEKIRDLLSQDGWTATSSGRFTRGIDDVGNGWQVHSSKSDLSVRVALYHDHSAIAVRVSSGCVQVSDSLDDALTVNASRPLDVGATSTTVPSSTWP